MLYYVLSTWNSYQVVQMRHEITLSELQLLDLFDRLYLCSNVMGMGKWLCEGASSPSTFRLHPSEAHVKWEVSVPSGLFADVAGAWPDDPVGFVLLDGVADPADRPAEGEQR